IRKSRRSRSRQPGNQGAGRHFGNRHRPRTTGISDARARIATEGGAPVAGPTLVLSELRAKHTDKAAEVASSLLKRDAKKPLYHTLLGAVRVAQRDYPAAENSFRAALAINPEFPPAARGLAQLYVATGRIGDAKKVYADLLARKADDVGALLGLADIYISEKKWPEAIDAVNRARSAAKNDPAPGLKLVGLYESRKDWTSAR